MFVKSYWFRVQGTCEEYSPVNMYRAVLAREIQNHVVASMPFPLLNSARGFWETQSIVNPARPPIMNNHGTIMEMSRKSGGTTRLKTPSTPNPKQRGRLYSLFNSSKNIPA